MRRLTLAALLALLSLVFVPGGAAADGLPVPVDGADTASAISPTGEGPRYATVDAGDDTRLLQIDPDGGEITGSKTIEGNYSIPLVAVDGTAAGVSADGSVVALINPRRTFPRDETSFVIVDVIGTRMFVSDPLTLRGDFSFDALSPDGRMMYLVEYTSSDYNDYSVREYDLERQRLLPDPVLVAHEVSPDEMRGLPLTRASSSDGVWEYTLYNGGGRRTDEAFIHTLDTERGISHCVDLPMVDGEEAYRVQLELSGDDGSLNVMRGGNQIAALDTESFALSTPEAPGSAASEQSGGLSGVAVGALAVGIALIAGTIVGLRRRRQAGLPADPFGPGDPAVEATADEPERERVSP